MGGSLMVAQFTGDRRFSCGPRGLNLNFIRRPVSRPPEEGAVCFIDTGWDDGKSFGWNWRGVGIYRDGKFVDQKGRPVDREITYWSELQGLARAK